MFEQIQREKENQVKQPLNNNIILQAGNAATLQMFQQAGRAIQHGQGGVEPVVQRAPEPKIVSGLDRISTTKEEDVERAARAMEEITQEGRMQADFERKLKSVAVDHWKTKFIEVIQALKVDDLKRIPVSVQSEQDKTDFLDGLKADMERKVTNLQVSREAKDDKMKCLIELETAFSYFRGNAIAGEYIHPSSFIFDVPVHPAVAKADTPNAADTPSHKKALDNLPYVMARDDSLSGILAQEDAAHRGDVACHPVVTGQAIQEALAAREYAKTEGLVSYERSQTPQLDFTGTTPEGKKVYFDPFALPQDAELYKDGATFGEKAQSTFEKTYLAHTLNKNDVANALSVATEGGGDIKGSYTGVMDTTYSPHRVTPPTSERLLAIAKGNKADIKARLDAPSISDVPASHPVSEAKQVRVPLAEEYAKEHLLVEQYYGFIKESIERKLIERRMERVDMERLLPQVRLTVQRQLEAEEGSDIYNFPAKEYADAAVSKAVEEALLACGYRQA